MTGHSAGIASARRGEARSVMDYTLGHIKAEMMEVLRNDTSVRENAFPPDFSREAFGGFVLDNLMLLLVQGWPNCRMLLEIIRRTLGR